MRLTMTIVTLSLLAVPASADVVTKPGGKAPAITSQDDWEAPFIDKRSSVLKFGGDEWEFRATLKNKGTLKTSGKGLTARVTITAGSTTLLSSSSSLRPGSLAPGATYDFDFKVKSPLKGDAKVVKLVFDAGDGLKATKEFPITK